MSCIEGVIMGRVGDVVLRVGQTLVAVTWLVVFGIALAHLAELAHLRPTS